MKKSIKKPLTIEIEESLLLDLPQNQLFKQLNSISFYVVDGENKFGEKLSPDLINHCLWFEQKIKNCSSIDITANFNNSQPSYTLYMVRKNPLKDPYSPYMEKLYKVIDVFPRIRNGRSVFHVNDQRIFSPIGIGKKEKFFSWEELVVIIHNRNYGMDVYEYMRINGLNSFSQHIVSELNKEEIISIEL